MKEFSFSIIVPSFNAANTLPETLASIVPQLSEHDEIIVVDDGSTDETPDVMEGWSTSRVRYVRQANSGGPASPRNRGIREANGSLIALFDSDDIMLPGKLEATRQAFSHYPDAGLLFTNFSTIDELGNVLSSRFLDSYTFTGPFCAKDEACVRIEPPEAYRALGSENYIGTSGVVIPRKVFDRLGGFDESLTNGDDRGSVVPGDAPRGGPVFAWLLPRLSYWKFKHFQGQCKKTHPLENKSFGKAIGQST